MPPCFQGADDGEEFPVIYLVVSFCGVEGLGKVTAWVVCSILISLEKDSTSGYEGGISGEGKLSGGVRVSEDRF